MSAIATCWEDAYRKQVEAIKELRKENASLRKDKERIDWLDSVGCWLTIPGYTKNNVWCWGASREVIDLARKEAQS